MAQRNPEQYVDSTSVGDGQGAQRGEELDVGGLTGQLHEPPTSQVGYGGGEDRFVPTPSPQKQGLWEEKSNDEDSRYGQDRRGDREAPSSGVGYGGGDDVFVPTPGSQQEGDWEEKSNEGDSKFAQKRRLESGSGSRAEQDEGALSRYSNVNPKSNPDEAELGSSGRGQFSDEGNSVGRFGNASSKSSGNYSRWDADGSSTGYGSEVRNGVPHRVTSDGVASGVGISNGSRRATSDDVQQHAFHLTDVSSSQQKDTPYSQVFTELDGPSEVNPDQSHEEEGISGNTKGGTAADHDREAAMTEDGEEPEKKEFLTKLKHKLLGHGQKDEVIDSSSDVQAVDTDRVLQGDEEEKTGLVTNLKNKLRPNHDKHQDEMDLDSDPVLQGEGTEQPGLVTNLKHKLLPKHDKHRDEINPEIFE